MQIRNVTHLFQPLTTWIGVPELEGQPDSTFEFISLLAPQFDAATIRGLRHCRSQIEVDQLIAPAIIPFRR